MRTVPELGCRFAAATWSRVVLPAPFGPITTHRSPSATDQLTASSNRWPSRTTEAATRSRTSDIVLPLGRFRARLRLGRFPARFSAVRVGGLPLRTPAGNLRHVERIPWHACWTNAD